jgi:hypothetical protein
MTAMQTAALPALYSGPFNTLHSLGIDRGNYIAVHSNNPVAAAQLRRRKYGVLPRPRGQRFCREAKMTDEKNVIAATALLFNTIEQMLLRDGFRPDTVIAALIHTAVATAHNVPDWTPDEAKALINLKVENSFAGIVDSGPTH